MQARYALLLTFDELSQLSNGTKTELANLDPEFAKIVGVPTAANPPAAPENPRPTTQQGTTTVIMPERNQVNQQNSPFYNQMMSGGIPGVPQMPNMPPQAAPVVPSAVPVQHMAAPAPPASPQVVNPMPGLPPQFQMPQQAAQQAPPAPQPTPQIPYQQPSIPHPSQVQQPQEQAPFPGYDVRTVKEQIFPQQVMAKFGGQFAIALIQEAASSGIFNRPSLDCLNDSNVNQFMQLVGVRTQQAGG